VLIVVGANEEGGVTLMEVGSDGGVGEGLCGELWMH
jgi:hypothetical protein